MTLDDAMRALLRDELRKLLLELLPRGSSPVPQQVPCNDRYLTYAEAASHASVSKGTVRNWVKQGFLKASGPERTPRIRLRELDALMSKQRDGENIVDVEQEIANLLAPRRRAA